ncbi:hypothetical protein KBB17_03615 [Candidatus Saccharibacteria bacterium]|jgi:hypothetical protein|nr:hypothetical protein [Candidatus Saccharibacteria bacterium]MBP9131961.1 hypothetical protein [Candidatus Saccharibacteria bacterium]
MTHPIDYGLENLDPGELARRQAFRAPHDHGIARVPGVVEKAFANVETAEIPPLQDDEQGPDASPNLVSGDEVPKES